MSTDKSVIVVSKTGQQAQMVKAGRTHSRIDRRLALQLLGLSLLIGLLLALLGGWLWLKSLPAKAPELPPTIVDKPIEEPEFQETATAEELLALAEKEIQGLLAKYPNNATALSAQARKAMLLADSATAKRAWTRALELDPRFVEALYGLGLLAFSADAYAESVVFFEDVLNLNSGDPLVPVMLADSLLHAGEITEGILRLEQHLTSEPASVQAWELLGKLQLQARNYQRAIICFERVLEYDANSKDAVFGLSRAYAATGAKEKAQTYNTKFRELAQVAREDNAREANAFQDRHYAGHVAAQVYLDMARIERTENDLPAAERALLRAVALDPQNHEYMIDLQNLMLDQEKHSDVVVITTRILEQLPEDIDQWLILGKANSQLGRADDAIRAFEQAIALNPEDPRCVQAEQFIRELRK